MHTSTRMQQSVLNESGSGLTQLQKEEVWAGKRVHFMNDNKVSELPPSPNCPSLIELYLQWNYELTAIPPLFFQRIALLQVLDLSHTSIKCLPKSLPKLVALKKLLLRRCQLFMELSPLVGKLSNLEELDLDETQIMDMPREIGKLLKLRHLRVSFYQICGKKKSKLNIVIHPETISNLSQLTLLSIDVNPTDKRWDDSVEAVVKEVCNSKTLMTLSLYLPKFQLLDCISSLYPSLSGFRFIVGHHKRRIISRVPREVEAEFRNWDKCLKFVNGENIPIEIKGVLKYSTSFFLDHHATATNLSEFGIENMKRLKFCLLVDCNKMETIIDGERHYDGNEDDPAESDPSPVENVLESLEYLSIYYVENLESIWRGPYRYGCMSKLKFLALHACPQLINIFSHTLLGNFVNLEEFILEDCPLVTCLVSHASVKPTMSDKFLPSLTRLLLLYLPELVSISNGLLIAPKLETIGFYNCPKLKSISKMELSSKTLKIIKGELQWWEDMKWNEAEWGNQPDYLMRIFSPIDKEKDVMTQLAEDRDLFGVTKQNEGQQIGNCGSLLSDYTEERITETDVTKSTSSVCMLPSTPWTEAPKQAWSFSSVENKRIEDDCFDLASETSEVDDDEDEPKAKRWNCTENENKGVIGFASKIARGDRTEFRIKSNVDIVDDGYKWRKYGRKIIKGNPHPTNYYKCMTLGCPMRKRVVRDSQDTSFLVVTYEGIHNHEGPSVKALNNVGDAAEAAKTISPTKGYGDVLEASIQDTGLHPGIPEASIPDESQQSGVTMTENSNDPSARTLKQPRFVWSMELHWRFVDVVARLGIQEAVPKTIMQLMDVKGLTLKNVATHLKKYRIYLRMQELRNQGPSSFDQLLASKSVPQSLHEGGSGGGGGSVVGGGSANGDGHMGMAISMPSGAPMTPMPIPMYGNDQQGTISREENNASDVCHLPQPSPSTNSTTISQLSANTLPTARLQAPSFEEVAKQSQSKGNLQANYGNYYKKYSHFVKCRKSDDACTWRCYGIKGLTVNRRRSLYKCARPGCPVLEFLRKRKNMKTETNFTTTSLIANS